MKKSGSILRIKPDSESDEDEAIEEVAMDQSESEEVSDQRSSKQVKKIRKKGIIYISSIPKHMNVAICREMMEHFGEVGRIFLQPDSKGSEYNKYNC